MSSAETQGGLTGVRQLGLAALFNSLRLEDRIERDVVPEEPTILAVVQDRLLDVLVLRVIDELRKVEGRLAKLGVLAVVVVVPEREHKLFGEAVDEQELRLVPGRVESVLE
jgi:hypothetical protein